jgi:putative two-component system response regulator
LGVFLCLSIWGTVYFSKSAQIQDGFIWQTFTLWDLLQSEKTRAEEVNMKDEAVPAILAVDDEESITRTVTWLLKASGYSPTSAHSASEALETLASGRFDLLLADITMPVMSGIELLEEAKRLYPDLAVIMLTAVDNHETAIHALELGAYGYVIKPFNNSELLINIANALRRRKLEKMRDEYEQRLEFQVRERTQEIRRAQEEVIYRLVAASEFRNNETGAHIKRIGRYASVLAQALGWSLRESEDLRLAAYMHDVGKIGVPDEILLKPGKFTAEEFEKMKEHSNIGASILKGADTQLLITASEIALSHHEKWDGSGYPHGLREEAIPLSARITAVCDVYDALVSPRVYRPAITEEDALEIMKKGRGLHFDPEIFDRFLDCLLKFHRIWIETAQEEASRGRI